MSRRGRWSGRAAHCGPTAHLMHRPHSGEGPTSGDPDAWKGLGVRLVPPAFRPACVGSPRHAARRPGSSPADSEAPRCTGPPANRSGPEMSRDAVPAGRCGRRPGKRGGEDRGKVRWTVSRRTGDPGSRVRRERHRRRPGAARTAPADPARYRRRLRANRDPPDIGARRPDRHRFEGGPEGHQGRSRAGRRKRPPSTRPESASAPLTTGLGPMAARWLPSGLACRGARGQEAFLDALAAIGAPVSEAAGLPCPGQGRGVRNPIGATAPRQGGEDDGPVETGPAGAQRPRAVVGHGAGHRLAPGRAGGDAAASRPTPAPDWADACHARHASCGRQSGALAGQTPVPIAAPVMPPRSAGASARPPCR